MENDNIKEEFRENLLKLVDIENWIEHYNKKLEGVERELADLDERRLSNIRTKNNLSTVKRMQALQHISDIICGKLKQLKDEKINVQKKLLEIAPNGVMDDGYYSPEIMKDMVLSVNEVANNPPKNLDKKKFTPSEEDLKAFELVYPGQQLGDVSAKYSISEKELIKFAKEYIEFTKKNTKFDEANDDLKK